MLLVPLAIVKNAVEIICALYVIVDFSLELTKNLVLNAQFQVVLFVQLIIHVHLVSLGIILIALLKDVAFVLTHVLNVIQKVGV